MSQIIDRVFVSTEPFTELGHRNRSPEECYRFCLDVDIFATHLMLLGFRNDEMPRSLIHVYRVTELVMRTEPVDDVVDFLVEVEWSQALVEETIEALDEIGADAHARFLTALHLYLKGIQYKPPKNLDEIYKVIAKATEDHLSSDILQKRYGNFGVNGDRERRLYSICLHAVEYMEGWTNIERVPGGAHNETELQKYFASEPAILQRLEEIEKNNSRPAQTSRFW